MSETNYTEPEPKRYHGIKNDKGAITSLEIYSAGRFSVLLPNKRLGLRKSDPAYTIDVGGSSAILVTYKIHFHSLSSKKHSAVKAQH